MPHTITDHPLWAQAKIYKRPENPEATGYVYGIFDSDSEIIYIGKTKSLEGRLANHEHAQREDVTILFLELPLEQMDDTEAQYILTFLPRLNKSFPKSPRLSSLDAYQKVDTRFYSKRVQVLRLLQCMAITGQMGYFKTKDLEKISMLMDEEGVNND